MLLLLLLLQACKPANAFIMGVLESTIQEAPASCLQLCKPASGLACWPVCLLDCLIA
jgi:hypothetical protein